MLWSDLWREQITINEECVREKLDAIREGFREKENE
jgi:hypothetical protein